MAIPKFYLENREGKTENIPIVLKYSFNGQRLEYFTQHKVDKKFYEKAYWKTQNGRAIKKKAPDSEFLNDSLNIIKEHVQNIEIIAKATGVPLTTDYFRKELNKRLKTKKKTEAEINADSCPLTFIKFFEDFIERSKTRVNNKGQLLSRSTPIKYTTVKNMLEEFEKERKKQIEFKDIDKRFYDELVTYMITKKKYSINTYGRAIKFIKTVLNAASELGLNTRMDYKTALKGVTEPSDSTYLTEAELVKMFEYDLSNNFRLERVRDLFLIGCWTGLRFSDFTTIQPGDINGDRIRVRTKKTNHKVIIPIHKTVREIFEKYHYELPSAISNQKFNKYISEVAELAEISEPFTKTITRAGKIETTTLPKYKFVTSHVARRSFATNAYKRKVEPLLIMAITGHKTETEFLKYLKVTEEEKAQMFQDAAKW